MSKDFIGYQVLLDAALRGVVRDALRRIEKQGLVGSHHFYLTFKTGFPGVDIPSFLTEQYPDEMTIILQHQFWGLKVYDDYFEVALTFRKLPATLTIPFQALTKFFDPGVPFGLEFKTAEAEVKQGHIAMAPDPDAEPSAESGVEPGPESAAESKDDEPKEPPAHVEKPSGAGEVVSLDSFRKK
jgi:uncharacterized protein